MEFALLVTEDIDQMLEAQSERRRRSGREELTEEAVRAQVEAERRALSERLRDAPPRSPER